MILPVISVVAVATILSAVAWLSVRFGTNSGVVVRVACIFLGALCFVAAPLVAEIWAATRSAHRNGIWFVELSVVLLLVPVAVGALIGWVAERQRPSVASARGIIVLYAWSGLFGVFNTANWCRPGWCGRYGFPLAYYSWSDAVIIWNGVSPEPFHSLGAVIDFSCFLAGAILFYRLASKGVLRSAA